jgi:hypothetical protein
MKTTFCFILCAVALISAGCSSLILQPADFSWPKEELITPDVNGTVKIPRYQISFSSKPLLFEELQDSVNVAKHPLNVIRDKNGYFFITAKGFKNIYVFCQGEGVLKLEKKIKISEEGLEAPAFNQKGLIELVNEMKENGPKIYISNDGIQEGEKK